MKKALRLGSLACSWPAARVASSTFGLVAAGALALAGGLCSGCASSASQDGATPPPGTGGSRGTHATGGHSGGGGEVGSGAGGGAGGTSGGGSSGAAGHGGTTGGPAADGGATAEASAGGRSGDANRPVADASAPDVAPDVAPDLAAPSIDQLPPQGKKALDAWLAAGHYKTWTCEEKVMNPRPLGVHGRNRVCSNALARAAGATGAYPVGAASVKELYGGSTVSAYAVSVKVKPGDGGKTWYWYEEGDLEGVGVTGCTDCHGKAEQHGGHDFVFIQVK